MPERFECTTLAKKRYINPLLLLLYYRERSRCHRSTGFVFVGFQQTVVMVARNRCLKAAVPEQRVT